MAHPVDYQNWCFGVFTDSHVGSHVADVKRIWRSHGEHYAACNIGQHDWFNGRSVMVCRGISMEGCIELYRLGKDTVITFRYEVETLGLIVTGIVGPGFLLVHDNAQPHVGRICWKFVEN